MKRVFIAEDQTVLRSLLLRLLKSYKSVIVVGESADGKDAYEQCLELKPDIVILDIMMPKLNGLEVLKRIKKKLPMSRVLIFSEAKTKNMVSEVLQAGANGFVEKSADLEILELAINKLVNGENYFSPTISETVRDIVLHPTDKIDSLDVLTHREREILQLVAEGNTSKEIATSLDITFKTAETHRSRMMAKLDLHNIADLTRFAIRVGLIDEPKMP